EALLYASSPLSIPQLGIAYWVESRIDHVEEGSPAARARRLVKDKDQDHVSEAVPDSLRRGGAIFRSRLPASAPGGPKHWGNWHELKSKRGDKEVYERWASAFLSTQVRGNRLIELGIRRDGEEIKEPFEVILEPDPSWPLEGQDRGLYLALDIHLERAEGM